MQHIHWLGTGLSSIPGIRRISQNYENVTIWNRTLEKAQQSISHVDKQNVTAKKFDIESLTSVLNAGDIVVSQLPANHHLTIAKLCLDKKCHFASSSYISPDMKNLNDEAKRNHLVFVNEVGLDPGIDHFFSHLLVKKLKQTGLSNLDVTYHSYCGGFPAIPNDFKYKFSWSPVGVIKALNNDAKEFVRGTLRLNGWENAWKDIFEMLSNKSPDLDTKINDLGEELWKKHPYSPGEEDRVVLYVNLLAHQNNREVFNKYYFLDEKGSGENTAMGILVSITLSCAIDLILEKKLESGVQAAPYDENLINYFFKTFEEYNIDIKNSL